MTVAVDKLVRMAEQIALNITASKDSAIVAERVADHLTRFWDPRMRAAIIEHLSKDEAEASPAVRLAVDKLQGV